MSTPIPYVVVASMSAVVIAAIGRAPGTHAHTFRDTVDIHYGEPFAPRAAHVTVANAVRRLLTERLSVRVGGVHDALLPVQLVVNVDQGAQPLAMMLADVGTLPVPVVLGERAATDADAYTLPRSRVIAHLVKVLHDDRLRILEELPGGGRSALETALQSMGNDGEPAPLLATIAIAVWFAEGTRPIPGRIGCGLR